MPASEQEFQELEHRLSNAENLVNALRNQEIDAIVGDHHVSLIQLKEVADTIRNSRELYRHIVRDAPIGIAEIDLDSRFFITVNTQLLTYTGYSRDDFAKIKINQLLSPESLELFNNQIHNRSTPNALNQLQIKCRRKDGSEFWGLVNIKITYNKNQPKTAIITISDISKQKELEREVEHDIYKRRRAEEELRQSHKALNRAQALAKVGSWQLKIKEGELTWSDEAYAIFGIPRGTPMTYERFLKAVYPDDRAEVDRRWQAALKGEPYSVQHRIIAHTEFKWVHERGELEFNGNGVPQTGFGTVQDITEQKNAERKIEYLASFPELNQNPIIEVRRRRVITYSNPAARKLFPNLVVEGMNNPLIAPLDLQQGFSVQEIFVKGIWYAASLIPIPETDTVRVYYTDITQQKKNEQKIATELEAMKRLSEVSNAFTSEEKVPDLLNKILITAIEISSADFGDIVLLNPQTGDLSVAASQGFSKEWGVYWNQNAKTQSLDHFAIEERKRITVDNVEESPFFKDSPALKEFQKAGVKAVQSTPLMSRTGQPVGTIATHYKNTNIPNHDTFRYFDLLARQAADIIARLRFEQKLEERNQQLEHRTEEVTAAYKDLESFSYAVSHDLRAPLRSIDGFSMALLEDYGTCVDSQGQDYLHRVRDSARHMDELIDAILRLSRQTRKPLECEVVDFSAMVNDVFQKLREEHPERKVNVLIGKCRAYCDRELCRTALENLIRNAWKFTMKKPEACIEVNCMKKNGELVYFVRDNGAGFDMAYYDKLFVPFQRLHDARDYPGIGIGLSTVKQIVNKHGGRIWAESEPGKGATFFFTLPEK